MATGSALPWAGRNVVKMTPGRSGGADACSAPAAAVNMLHTALETSLGSAELENSALMAAPES